MTGDSVSSSRPLVDGDGRRLELSGGLGGGRVFADGAPRDSLDTLVPCQIEQTNATISRCLA